MSSLNGKFAVVTGSSRGIGRAIALALAREGAAVTVNHARIESEGEARSAAEEIESAGGRARIVRADVSVMSDLDRLILEAERFGGGLDIVVANAGWSNAFQPIQETSPDDWDRITSINQRAVFFLLQRAARVVRENGRVIVISSSMTSSPYAGTGVYAGAKAATEIYVRTLALELGHRQITVNAVAPGLTDTAAMRAVVPEERLSVAVARTPLGRLGQPEDVAEVVAFLARPRGALDHGPGRSCRRRCSLKTHS